MTLTSDPTETDQVPPAAKGRWIHWAPEDGRSGSTRQGGRQAAT